MRMDGEDLFALLEATHAEIGIGTAWHAHTIELNSAGGSKIRRGRYKSEIQQADLATSMYNFNLFPKNCQFASEF